MFSVSVYVNMVDHTNYVYTHHTDGTYTVFSCEYPNLSPRVSQFFKGYVT